MVLDYDLRFWDLLITQKFHSYTMSDPSDSARSRSNSRAPRTRTRSLSLQRRASVHNSPAARAKAELPEQFRRRRSPPRPHTSSEESLDLGGIEDVDKLASYNEELSAVRVQVEAMREEVTPGGRLFDRMERWPS